VTRWIAFLRAINVGKRIVKMDALRETFESLGFNDVATFIASGNVFFETTARDSGRLEQRIERNLKESLGYTVDTFLRSPAEIDAVAKYEPFPAADIDADGARLYVGFVRAAPAAASVRRLNELRSDIDDLHVHGREVWWLSRVPMSKTPVSGASIEKALGAAMTMRNITTIRRLAAKHPPD